ncbi:hypothetical protein EMIT0P218_10285 [Pseudomonas sp. IT-P218]
MGQISARQIIGWPHSCRSWLASDEGLEFNASFKAPFAGKPAPTRFLSAIKNRAALGPPGFG